MKKILFVLAILIAGCSKVETDCYDINGTFTLTRIVENGKVVCVYDNTFYYSYKFETGIAYVTQYRNGQDSFIRSFTADCNSVFNKTPDSFYYGSPIDYAVLKK